MSQDIAQPLESYKNKSDEELVANGKLVLNTRNAAAPINDELGKIIKA